jgi:RNA polymerase sigma-70 factor (ECF subfamily)
MTLSKPALDGLRHSGQHPFMREDRCIFEEYSGRMRAFIASRSNNRSDVEDMTQEIFLRFYSLRQGREIDHPLGYLYRIALNLMIDRSRRRSPLNHAIEIDDVSESVLSTKPRQEEARRAVDLQCAYQAALAELSPRCAQVFRLRRHNEMATPEVAAHLSITTRMVQKHMVTAMAHLQHRLRPFLFDDYSEPDDIDGPSVPARCQIISSSAAHA